MIEFFEPYFLFSDTRGSIRGISNNFVFEEINLITSEKDCIRGGHYHKNTLEFFFVLDGLIQIDLFHIDTPHKVEKHIVEKNHFFCIFPNIVHTFKALEKSLWINILDKKMQEHNKDLLTLLDKGVRI